MALRASRARRSAGAGKTFTGAQMICELVRRGRTVGITANSHKVIRNLSDVVIQSADQRGLDLHCCQKKPAEMEDAQPHLSFARSNKDVFTALSETAMVGAGTVWLWAAPEAFERVDVLFVDEAAQMSLANVLAASLDRWSETASCSSWGPMGGTRRQPRECRCDAHKRFCTSGESVAQLSGR
jgi:hypothetical protein